MIYIGIDPGMSGGIAVIYRCPPMVKGLDKVEVFPMPKTKADLVHLLDNYRPWDDDDLMVWCEDVHSMPGNGVASMFKFGVGFGVIQGYLAARFTPVEYIRPQKWQKVLGIPPKKKTETKTEWKNRLKQRAQELFPGVQVTLATCDALLIAEACRRVHGGGHVQDAERADE